MKMLNFFLLFFLVTSLSYAQDQEKTDTTKNWKITGLASINFSQTSFSENWQSGGVNSVSGLGLFNTNAQYKKNKSAWENILDIKYGLTKQGDDDVKKTDDIFEFISKYGYKAAKNWYYSAFLDFKTQLDKGYDATNTDSVISKFLAPAYIQISLGMDYKPSENFSVLIAPLTAKITIVNDTAFSNKGLFGVDPGDKARYEFGASINSFLKYEIIKNVTLNSKLDMFYNYTDDPQLDVNWEVVLNMKINEFLSTNIITQLLYDKDMVDEVQFKEVFGIGINYKF